jgi:hypothetical protein
MNAFLSYRVSTLLVAVGIIVAIASSVIFGTHALLIPAIPLMFRFFASGKVWHGALGAVFIVAFLVVTFGKFGDTRVERLDPFHFIVYAAPLCMILGLLYPMFLRRWWPEAVDPTISEQNAGDRRPSL